MHHDVGCAKTAVLTSDAGMYVQNLKWEFAVIDEPDTPNAFVTPGGKVVVFTGLLKLLQMHDDEIAAVLGHEVAHVLARHIVSAF